jgi:chromosomal replication initiator protein
MTNLQVAGLVESKGAAVPVHGTDHGTGHGTDKGPDIKVVWERIKQRIKAELGDDLFTSWFARMEADSLTSGKLIVSVPTRFLKSWIENHYVAKLTKIAATELAGLDHVQLRVRSSMPSAKPQQSLTQQNQRADRSTDRGSALQQATAPNFGPSFSGAAPGMAERGVTIDENQSFENFMVGGSNQLAHAAAMRVANAAQGAPISFNPLYIHAAAGLGKTHLLNAIAQRVKATHPARRVLMLTAERFMYGFIHALRNRDTLAFKDQFQSVDVLLIDDFQFMQGKAMQQEFCHAFNSLVDQRRQVVIAADVPPTQLDTIDQRMRSRMLGGLVVDIEVPDADLRARVLAARHAAMLQLDPTAVISKEIMDFIAERVQGGGRELEGALNKVVAYQQLNKAPITADLASMLLRDDNALVDNGRIKIEDIMKVVGRHFNVAKADLLSPRRARSVVVPRQIGMYLAKKLTSRSLPEIGRRFGGRDHSTVLHAVRKIDEQIRGDEKLARDVALLIRLVEQNG